MNSATDFQVNINQHVSYNCTGSPHSLYSRRKRGSGICHVCVFGKRRTRDLFLCWLLMCLIRTSRFRISWYLETDQDPWIRTGLRILILHFSSVSGFQNVTKKALFPSSFTSFFKDNKSSQKTTETKVFVDGRIRIRTNNYWSGTRRPKKLTDLDSEQCVQGINSTRHRLNMDPDPDPLVRGMDPDPSLIKQK